MQCIMDVEGFVVVLNVDVRGVRKCGALAIRLSGTPVGL